MKNLRKMCFIYFLLFTFSVAFQVTPSHADENDVNGTKDSGTMANAAQVQHAQNLAEDAALRDPRVSSLNEYLAYAEQELKDAVLSKDQERIDAAQKAYDSAKANYEKAYAEEVTATREEIAAMREQDMGWGEIAHKLGVHPSVLGLGNAKQKNSLRNQVQAREQKQTTSQGTSSQADKGKGLGLGRAGDTDGKGKGQGSSAGRGGGNSGGRGGGHGGSGGHGGGGGQGGGGGNK